MLANALRFRITYILCLCFTAVVLIAWYTISYCYKLALSGSVVSLSLLLYNDDSSIGDTTALFGGNIRADAPLGGTSGSIVADAPFHDDIFDKMFADLNDDDVDGK
jgi:hypothetical protein